MSILGFAEHTVADLLGPLRPHGQENHREHLGEIFARAVWTGIVEPGDRVGSLIVQTLGAEKALGLLIDDHEGRLLLDALAEREVLPGQAVIGDAVARWTPRLSKRNALLACQQAARFSVELVVPGDSVWPVLLEDLGEYAPLALWLRGRRELLSELGRGIAVVGARAATGYGEHVTVDIASGLSDRGYLIVSGAAYGIDGTAHRAALASNTETVAFLAGGLDRLYPAGHTELLHRVMERGIVLAEVPCGVTPTRWRFLQRNRLIAAGSRATVVVEAGQRSGSLNTAGHAATLGRPLGAVPGPVTSLASRGCHRLLREFGAVCVTSAAEVAELVPISEISETLTEDSAHIRQVDKNDPENIEIRLFDSLSTRSARSVEKIAALAGLSTTKVQAELALLEIEGTVRQKTTGWVKA